MLYILYIDSLGQIRVGLSKPFWTIRYKEIIYKPYLGMISTPFQLKKLRPDRQNHQNCPKTSKCNQDQPQHFENKSKNRPSPQEFHPL